MSAKRSVPSSSRRAREPLGVDGPRECARSLSRDEARGRRWRGPRSSTRARARRSARRAASSCRSSSRGRRGRGMARTCARSLATASRPVHDEALDDLAAAPPRRRSRRRRRASRRRTRRARAPGRSLTPISQRSRQLDEHARTTSLATPRLASASFRRTTISSDPFSAHEPLGCPSGRRLVHTKR